MSYNYLSLKHFLNSLDQAPEDLGYYLFHHKHVVSRKGYGTPELEMLFLHKVFLFIQEKVPEFESFSWIQTNDYNDEYYHFDLNYFTLNEKVEVDCGIEFNYDSYEGKKMESKIHISTIEYKNSPDEIEFAQLQNISIDKSYGLPDKYYSKFYDYLNEKYKHLQATCLKLISFLKLIELNYSMYYFLYVFGNGVKVKINKNGIELINININDYDGSPLGTGMYLDEF